MTESNLIEESNLSKAWAKCLQLASKQPNGEVTPLMVSLSGFGKDGKIQETPEIRTSLDAILKNSLKPSVHAVANTVFPESLWNPKLPREKLFERYIKIQPKIKEAEFYSNKGETYFQRLTLGGPKPKENQLDLVISLFQARKASPKCLLRISLFHLPNDYETLVDRGFPTLQHLNFNTTPRGLCVNAFYSTQNLIAHAYGDYLGLCRLGRFVAHEMGMPLLKVTCLTSVAEVENNKENKAFIAKLNKELAP